MKNIVRAFVLTLALTGMFATVHANTTSATAQAAFSKASAMPVPTCPPNDPNGCGIGDW